MADTMEAVAADAAKVELTIPELKKLSQDYQTMAKEVAKAGREMVAAADSQDFAKVNTAKAAVEKAVKEEDPIVESINKFCHAP
jgi:enoyl-[acyl-carrier-protein] reductase (NADH)